MRNPPRHTSEQLTTVMKLDGDEFLGCGTASLAAATEFLHPRYYSLVGNSSSKPPGGSGGVVLLRLRVWRERHRAERSSDWYRVIRTLPL